MSRVMLIYPPGKAYQRSEDRAQCNLEESVVATARACNDIGYAAAVLRKRGHDVFLRDYQTEKSDCEEVKRDILSFLPEIITISTTNATILDDINFINSINEFYCCKFIIKGAIFFNIDIPLLETLNLENVDYLVGGEIDTIVGQLVDFIAYGKGVIDDIGGIIYKRNGKFIKTHFKK